MRSLAIMRSSSRFVLAALPVFASCNGRDDLPISADPSYLYSSEGGTGGRQDAGGIVGGGAGGAPATPPDVGCPKPVGGPTMARVPSPKGIDFCIDSTVVTQGQYAAFLKANNVQPRQPPYTASATLYDIPTLDPHSDMSTYGCPAGVYDPVTKADYPMRCATWYDAEAFCKWDGKRLCGAIGGGPISNLDDETVFESAAVSEWVSTCSQAGTTQFPYGNEAVDACQPGGDTPVPTIAAAKMCAGAGPFANVTGMVGVVYQWENACLHNDCFARGVPRTSGATGDVYVCTGYPVVMARAQMSATAGIRCCADAK